MARMRVKKGDLVQVLSGKDKGLQGKVIAAYPDKQRVLVEGVNRIKRHTKPDPSKTNVTTGGIITQEASVHVSNVMLVDPETKKPTRVGYRKDEDGRNVRFAKRTGKDI
jgi:large subunit ribosomal protein L24